MRKFLTIALLSSGFWTAHTQVQAQTQSALDSYETQKAKFHAARFESLTQVRALGKSADGKVIELRGQVKGSFAREGQRALLFQLAEGENIVIDAPEILRTAKATQPGASSRFLCRVQNIPGSDIALTLMSASDAPDPAQLFKIDDMETVVAPAPGQTLPPPDQIVLGGDDSVAPPKIIVAGKQTPKIAIKPGLIKPSLAKARSGHTLASRGLPRKTQASRAVSPYFGFDESQRAAYKSLARRHNPKLGDEMAGYIASSILMAAQTHRLDPRFLAAVVTVESSFDPYCLSSSGAMGLGQLMPFNLRPLGVANAWDPQQNLNGSAKLLRQNLDTYARQPNGTLLAVAAYHAGVGAVNRAGKAVPPRAATQKYVWKVYYAYRALAPELFSR